MVKKDFGDEFKGANPLGKVLFNENKNIALVFNVFICGQQLNYWKKC